MTSGEITELLQAWREGDEQALQQLVPLVYTELRGLARHYMNQERQGHTLGATALVHEAYTRLIRTPRVDWHSRSHFYAVCATLMRRVLVDYSRTRGYLKRGGGMVPVPLEVIPDVGSQREVDLVALDDALTALAAFDRRKSQVVELRFFGGLSVEECAEVLNISPDTVMREWKMAKAWLLRALDSERASDS